MKKGDNFYAMTPKSSSKVVHLRRKSSKIIQVLLKKRAPISYIIQALLKKELQARKSFKNFFLRGQHSVPTRKYITIFYAHVHKSARIFFSVV